MAKNAVRGDHFVDLHDMVQLLICLAVDLL